MSSKRRKDRRSFPRAQTKAHAELVAKNGAWAVQVLDISYTGALVASRIECPLLGREAIELYVCAEAGSRIRLKGKLAHKNGKYLGLECTPMGIDNRSLLRRYLSDLGTSH
jgi:hypothetical protein